MPPTERDFTLGFIAEDASLVEGVEIPKGFFRSDLQRTVWATILELIEAGKPVSVAAIAEHAEGNGTVGYLAEITAGIYRIKPAEFRRRVYKQAAEDVMKRMHSLASADLPDLDELAALITEARRLELEAEAIDGKPAGPNFISRKADGIRTRPVEWLWPGVIPFGMTTLVEGDPDMGKTFVLADIIARVTQGVGFPRYGDQAPARSGPGNVVYISSEGVPDQILVPRLIAAGADLERVEIIEGIYDPHGAFEVLDVSQHLPAIALRQKKDPDFRALVVDPLASHLSAKLDMNSSLAMRNAMDAISRFAGETGCAPIVALHLNKDDRKAPIHRAAGSGQIVAAVKSAWAVYKKPGDDDKDRRYFGPVKSTCTPARHSFSFKITSSPVTFSTGQTGDIGRVAWNLATEDVDLQAAMSPGTFSLKSKVNDGIAFLRERLANGPRYATDLITEAALLGISKDRLWEAKRKEGIEDGREAYQGRSQWFYPVRKDRIQ